MSPLNHHPTIFVSLRALSLRCAWCTGSSAPHRIILLLLYADSMYTLAMATKSERWNLRVTPAQDTIVRQVLSATGMSLNEYVVSRTVAAAANDLADRRVFVLGPEAWDELQRLLDRPPVLSPEIAALLREPSILEVE